MKKFISFSICLTILFIIQLLSNCSQPLDTISDGGQFIIDTLYVIDTSEIADTNTFTDTIWLVDTVIIIDTLSFIDTMSFADTITLIEAFYCDRLNWFYRRIDWTLENHEGLYLFKFSVSTEQEYPRPSLLIEIDNQRYFWDLNEDFEVNIEQYLDPSAPISISYATLQSCNRTIEVCFRVKAL